MIRKINLKKQLAFILSFALIAGTALYMPANVGEILGINQSVSADDKYVVTFDISGYSCSYTNKFNKEVTYNDSEHFQMTKAKELATYSIMLYVPDDVALDSNIKLNNAFSLTYGNEGTEKFSLDETISLKDIRPDGTLIKKCKAKNTDPNNVIEFDVQTVYVKVKLVPAWRNWSDIKYGDYAFYTYFGDYREADCNVTYQKDTENNCYTRVYSIDKTPTTDEKNPLKYQKWDSIGERPIYDLDRVSYFSKYVNDESSTQIIPGDTVVVCNQIGDNEKINGNCEFSAANKSSVNVYYNDGFSCEENGGELIIENADLSENGKQYIIGKDNYLYCVNVSDSSFDIERVAKSSNGQIKVEYNSLIEIKFDFAGKTFDYVNNYLTDLNEKTSLKVPTGMEFSLSNYLQQTAAGYKLTDLKKDGKSIDLNKVTFDSDTTLVAEWSTWKYTVNFHIDGIESRTVDSNQETRVDFSSIGKDENGRPFVGFSIFENASTSGRYSSVGEDKYLTLRVGLTDEDGGTVDFYPVWRKRYFVTIDGKEYELSEPVLITDNNGDNYYAFEEIQLENIPYGKAVDYYFIDKSTHGSRRGSRYFNTEDSSLEVKESSDLMDKNGKYIYYILKFTQTPKLTCVDHLESGGKTFFLTDTTLTYNGYYAEHNEVETKKIKGGIFCDEKIEVVDNNYVKNYTYYLKPRLKANSEVTIDLPFTNEKSCTVTLDENGNAESKVMKSAETEEYIKLNFKMEDDYPVKTIDGSTDFTESYEVEGDHYVKVYTVNGDAPESRKSTIEFEFEKTVFFDEDNKPVYDTTLDIKDDGTTKTQVIGKTNGDTYWYEGDYIKVVYNSSTEHTITLNTKDKAGKVAEFGNVTTDSEGYFTFPTDKKPTLKGYIFRGWSKSENAETAEYVPGDRLKSRYNLTFYAVWEKIKSPSVKLGDKTYDATEEILKDETAENSVSNPYILELNVDSVEYGSKLSYEFIPPENSLNISGSKGTVTFNSSDGTAKTGIYQISVDGEKKYYQAEFSLNTSAENITHVKNNDGDTVIAADISLTYNTGGTATESTYFKSDDKIELIDGKYVKNYTATITELVKAESKINLTLKGFENGYGIGTTDNKFDITLGEDGTASTIFKVSSTWDGQDNVEYIKLNFKLNATWDSAISDINGDTSFTGSYKSDGNNYIRVYTVRSKIPETATVNLPVYGFMGADGNVTRTLKVNSDGTTDVNQIYYADIDDGTLTPTNYYIQVVFNPEYTLEFCDGDTVLTTKTETVGEKYVLPENPTKAGYKFAGWYTDKDVQIYSDMTIEQAHGTKVYAKWTPITYTVKIDANGGTAATTSENLEGNWNISSYGISVQLSDVAYNTEKDTIANDTKLVSRDGYELIGFSTDKNATTPDENLSFLDKDGNISSDKWISFSKLTTEENSTVTLYAVWRAEPKEVKFNNAKVIQDTKKEVMLELAPGLNIGTTEEFKVATDAKLGTLPTPTLKGYTFKGWYYKNDKSEWVEATADTVATAELLGYISGDGSGLVAYFTQNKYAINYDDCGTVKVSDTVSRDNTTGAVNFGYNLNGTICLYDADGKNALAYSVMATTPEKAGYEFVGYTINGIIEDNFSKTKAYFTADNIAKFLSGSEIPYKTSATEFGKLSIGAEDVTIKAIWKIDETKSIINVDYDDAVISYKNAKGTTITVKPTSSSYEKFPSTIVGTPGERISTECEIDSNDGLDNITFTDYGFDVDDTECTLSKDGYVFKGWFTKDANGKEIAFTSTTFTAGLTEIYAKWEAESNLTIPENVAVSADGTVTWNGGEGAAYFRVYKVYNGITKSAKTTSSPYTFQNLTKGVEHEIYVVAYDGNGNSLKSESIKFTPVSAPANVKVAEDGTVSWNGGEGAAYFRVYKVYNGITKNAKTESSPYTFQNLTEGVEHEIYVVAFDAQGNQYKSDSVKFTPEKKAVLTVPTNVKVDANGNVTWTAAENAAYYKVSKVVNGKTSTGKQVTGTEYTFQYIAKGVEHEIYVTAFDKDGNSLKSESIKFTPVSAPANVKVAEDGTVTWTKSEGAAYYRVYKKYGKTTKNAKVAATATSYTFQNLTEGVKYEIYVVAFDANGNQYKSESVMFTPAKKAVLTAPTNVKVDADGNVTWTAAENAAYYKVSKVVGGKTYTGKQTTDTKYTFLSFNPGQNKTVYVTAFDKDGNYLRSENVTVKAVENITVTATGTVTFDKVEGASYYRVYKEYNGTTKSAKTTASPYTFQTFTKGVKHDVYVKAYNAAGKEIATSKTVTVTAK